MSLAREITRKLGGDWKGDFGAVPGPGHSKADRGVTVRDCEHGDDVTVHSFHGDDWQAIKDDWRRQGLLPERPAKADKQRVVASFTYTDQYGAPVYVMERIEPGRDGRAKDFVARQPNGKLGMGGAKPVPYNLPDIAGPFDIADCANQTIYITEGERKADALAGWGLVATSQPFGGAKWRGDLTHWFKGRDIVILPDNDATGQGFAISAAHSLHGTARSVRLLILPDLPPKGDIIDWIEAGGTLEQFKALVGEVQAKPAWTPEQADTIDEQAGDTEHETAPGEQQSPFFDAADLEGVPVPERLWAVKDLVPDRTVTLLSGDGGTGKSLIALQLSVAGATGGKWLGSDVKPGPVMFLSAEDDAAELHRRLADIVRAEGLGFRDLKGKLIMRSLAGEDALLATLEQGGRLRQTPLYAAIDKQISETRPSLVVLDTLADLFPGNENDRTQARQFIGLLRRLAIVHECAVLLLAHPSLTGIGSGTGTSGSTGWNNSVRSRLYLKRIVDNGQEADPDARLLQTMKANYGRTGGEINLRWHQGVFIAPDLQPGADKITAQIKAEMVFMRLLRAFTEEGRHVSSFKGHAFAPKLFYDSGRAEGCSKVALTKAMEGLFANGTIRNVEHGPPSRRVRYIVETGAGE
jgi:RecA-family ATPase